MSKTLTRDQAVANLRDTAAALKLAGEIGAYEVITEVVYWLREPAVVAALTRDALPPGIEASEYRAKCLDADVGLESCRRSVFDDTLADLERHLIANRWTRHAAGWRCPYCENWRNR